MSRDNDEKRKEKDKKEMTETSEEKEQILELPPTESPEVQKLKDELNDLENKYLRLLADYQNLQKRTAQEKEDLYKYGSIKTIESLLPALDTFEYAQSTLKSDSKVEKIVEDFKLVFETILKSLKEVGLESIEEAGIPFDPHFHEPLHQIPTNELPDHTVMQILKKGYMLNKKVIRPALVSVSVKQEST